jgi:hypothetical protein
LNEDFFQRLERHSGHILLWVELEFRTDSGLDFAWMFGDPEHLECSRKMACSEFNDDDDDDDDDAENAGDTANPPCAKPFDLFGFDTT